MVRCIFFLFKENSVRYFLVGVLKILFEILHIVCLWALGLDVGVCQTFFLFLILLEFGAHACVRFSGKLYSLFKWEKLLILEKKEPKSSRNFVSFKPKKKTKRKNRTKKNNSGWVLFGP